MNRAEHGGGRQPTADAGAHGGRRAFAVLVTIAAFGACSLITPFEPGEPRDGGAPVDGDADGAGDGAPSDADADADADADQGEGDGGGGCPTGAGPLTFTFCGVAMAGTPIFDLDGDGHEDDAIAALGGDAATLFGGVLGTLLQGSLDGAGPEIWHFPWIGDRASRTEEQVLMLPVRAIDLDDPPDPGDDCSVGEAYYASPHSLDPCGEPLQHFHGGSLRDGILEGLQGTITFPLRDDGALVLDRAQARGTISEDCSSMELVVGGAMHIADLGGQADVTTVEDLTFLEVFLLGGDAFGLPAMPGLSPDLDLDGDGLETFVLAETGEIQRCIDGDRSVIEGRDCWRDPTMADAFALTFRWSAVSAAFEGRMPGWETQVTGTCTDPPENSLFDPPS